MASSPSLWRRLLTRVRDGRGFLECDRLQSRSSRRSWGNLGEPDRVVRDYDEIIRLQPGNSSVREERQLALEELEGG